ncbi:MAG TPA: hypothetical protein VGA73_18120 [Candidatus Binatia bacterium]
MPRVKRYFPVSQELNDDEEVWEFTGAFGDRALRTWMEILKILDKTENVLRVSPEWFASVSRRVRQTPANLRRQIVWMEAKGWLAIREAAADGSPRLLYSPNYSKYHNTREPQAGDRGFDKAPLRTLPSEPTGPKDAPPADASVKKNLDPEIQGAAARLYAARPGLFPRLVVWIKRKQVEGYGDAAIAAALRRFESSGAVPEEWWPYLDKILAQARTEMLQSESEIYKRGDLTRASALLGRLAQQIK